MTEAVQNPEQAASWVADNWPRLLAGAGQIILIILLAFIARYLVHRAIRKLTSGGDGKVPKLLQPLKERAPESLGPLLSERRKQRAQTMGSVLRSAFSILIYGVAFLMVLDVLGVNLTPILASASVLGVAIGFGAQNLVKDFLSGIFMLLEDQYGVGDVVDLGEASGTVESVGLRVTTLRDGNGTVWYVRNGTVMRVGNSTQGFAVAVVDVPLAYTVDVNRAIELIGETTAAATQVAPLADDVLAAPEVLGVEKVTSETITVRVTVKVRPSRQWAVQRALRAKVKSAVDEAGIEAQPVAAADS
ncbi:mechanosensitive ion channel family protein [Allokutzneria oryzae]|uniref:Mechanosensitive ion channel family protein n=1 Tax=Allokutzneria oryzae TaxID=1378989 RepID=A0ABV6A864_9PSEU